MITILIITLAVLAAELGIVAHMVHRDQRRLTEYYKERPHA